MSPRKTATTTTTRKDNNHEPQFGLYDFSNTPSARTGWYGRLSHTGIYELTPMNDNYIRIRDIHGVARIVGIAPPAPNARLEYDGKTLRTHRIWVDIAGSLQAIHYNLGSGRLFLPGRDPIDLGCLTRIRVLFRGTYQPLISFIGAGWGAYYPITHHTSDDTLINFLTAITRDPKDPGIKLYYKGAPS